MLSIPLAFAGLPIYVHIPHYYATTHAVDLVTVSIALLLVRFVDAFQDPLIGTLSDRSRFPRHRIIACAAIPLIAGFVALFSPPDVSAFWKAVWMTGSLLVVYTAFSTIIINYYAAGLTISADHHQRTRISAFREGFMMIGVTFAAALPSLLVRHHDDATAYLYFSLIFIPLTLLCVSIGVRALRHLNKAVTVSENHTPFFTQFRQQFALLHNPAIRFILLLFFFNSIPTAITSSLFMFYVEDVLQAKPQAGYMLLCFFAASGLSVAAWNRLSEHTGKWPALMGGITLSILVFIWTYGLDAGDVTAFYVVCVLSGVAIGADLTLLPSLYADALDKHTEQGGFGFSLWHFLNKLNLSLAAGIALPLLAWFGYTPSSGTGHAALPLMYAIVPCGFKCIALALTWRCHYHSLALKEATQ